MTSSTTTEVNNLSTLLTKLPAIRQIRNAFQLSISSDCGRTLSLVCVPPELINDPDHFYSYVATRSFMDATTLPPENSANVRVAVIGVLGDYTTYDKIGKALTKLATGYNHLFDCLDKAKDKRANGSAVVVTLQKPIKAAKHPRKAAERRPRSRPARPQISSSPEMPAPPATPPVTPLTTSPSPRPSPVKPASPARSRPDSPSPPSTSTSRSCTPVNSPSPCPSRPVFRSCGEGSLQLVTSCHSLFPPTAGSSSSSFINVSLPNSLPSPNPHSANSLQLTTSTPQIPGAKRQPPYSISGPSKIPRPIPPAKRPRQEPGTGRNPKRRRFHSPKRNDPSPSPSRIPIHTPTTRKPPGPPLQFPSPTPALVPPAATATLLPVVRSPSPTPPPPLDSRAPFQSPSPSLSPSLPAPRHAALPFLLEQIPERFHRFFLEGLIPAEFYPLFPRGFRYGAAATDASILHLMCIFLMGRQHGRYSILSHLLEIDDGNVSFLGTIINGVTRNPVPYIQPKTPSYKRCCFNCRESLSNKIAVLRHHKPRQFDGMAHPCVHFPGCLTCATPKDFYRERDLIGAGGLKICYHIYPSAQGTDHFKTQLLQLGQALLSFAWKDLKMTGDWSVNAWKEKEGGF